MKSNRALALLVAGLAASGWAKAESWTRRAAGLPPRPRSPSRLRPRPCIAPLCTTSAIGGKSQHTFSGNWHNLSIEEKPGGCFCEKLPNDGGVRHMEVMFVAPGKTIALAGGLGPLQSIAATGSMRIQLAPAEGGTKLEVTYAVVGYLPGA